MLSLAPIHGPPQGNLHSCSNHQFIPEQWKKKMNTSELQDCSIKPIHFNDIKLLCKKDCHGHPIVICEKNRKESFHTNLTSLIREVPELRKNQQQIFLALLANFLFKGEDFQLVIDPKKYKQEYRDQVEKEKNSFDLPLNPLISYGIFNVEEICPPYIKKGEGGYPDQFIFYVSKKIPYKVSVNFPISENNPKYKYEMLSDYE